LDQCRSTDSPQKPTERNLKADTKKRSRWQKDLSHPAATRQAEATKPRSQQQQSNTKRKSESECNRQTEGHSTAERRGTNIEPAIIEWEAYFEKIFSDHLNNKTSYN
jgi:hypothetical protein